MHRRAARTARAPRDGYQDGCRARASFLGFQMGRGLFFDAVPNFFGHRLARLLTDVPDEAHRARHDADPAHGLPVQSQLASESADSAGRVDDEVLFFSDGLHKLAIPAIEAGFPRDLE